MWSRLTKIIITLLVNKVHIGAAHCLPHELFFNLSEAHHKFHANTNNVVKHKQNNKIAEIDSRYVHDEINFEHAREIQEKYAAFMKFQI